jgi:hypothetical protein
MRFILTGLLVLLTIIVAPGARGAQRADAGQSTRCAYLGQCGSFHLIGDGGTAAYTLGGGQFIADLSFSSQDNDYWQYRAQNGDPSTGYWAFARRPDRCGRYMVWRFANGTWCRYESTRAWGKGLGESIAKAAASEPTNQELLDKLNDVLIKLDTIQPGARPSLEDIENQIRSRPPQAK